MYVKYCHKKTNDLIEIIKKELFTDFDFKKNRI